MSRSGHPTNHIQKGSCVNFQRNESRFLARLLTCRFARERKQRMARYEALARSAGAPDTKKEF